MWERRKSNREEAMDIIHSIVNNKHTTKIITTPRTISLYGKASGPTKK